MKPWILDVVIGVGSLIVLILLLKFVPSVVEPSLAYISALLIFALVVCSGGYLASTISSK
ncbi:MAG: hypothetical protein FWF19_00260 [Euryarchaeota archaeon]|nr:hypothetical protein [Euryarchaeota archaeon]